MENKVDYPNMKSTVNTQGEVVTQIIHFVGGIKRTYHGILTSSIISYHNFYISLYYSQE